MVSEKKMFLSFSHYKSRGTANLDPRGLNGGIYVGDHLTLLHTKYISCGPDSFREEESLSFPIISLWELYMGLAAILIYGSRLFV